MSSGAPRGGRRARRPWRIAGRLVGLAVLLGLVGVPLDALLVEPGWVQVTRHHVPLPGLPGRLDGLRVVQLTDIHLGPTVREADVDRAVDICNRLQPHLVVLTGDYVHQPAMRAALLARALSRLRAPLGIYAVPGNHDHWEGIAAAMRPLRHAGIRDVTNTSALAAPGLRVAGIDDMWSGRADLARAVSGHRSGEGLLLLSHSPRVLPKAARMGIAGVCLTGHTHGGQIRIPFVRRNRLPGLRGFPYIAGWYAEGPTRMYVNRGIGTVGLRVRLLCRPEVALFVLHTTDHAAAARSRRRDRSGSAPTATRMSPAARS